MDCCCCYSLQSQSNADHEITASVYQTQACFLTIIFFILILVSITITIAIIVCFLLLVSIITIDITTFNRSAIVNSENASGGSLSSCRLGQCIDLCSKLGSAIFYSFPIS
jgi:hypothetical protein